MNLNEMKKRFEVIHSSHAEPYPWIVRHDAYRELARDLIQLCEFYREDLACWCGNDYVEGKEEQDYV